MAQIYESLKSMVTSAMISKAAHTLEEDSSKISSGISTLIPSYLGRLIAIGENKRIEEIVRDAGKAGLYEHVEQLFEGKGIIDGKNYGERMENALIGSTNREFISSIASGAGLRHESADRLSNWVSGLIAAYIGRRMVKDNMGYKDILGLLGNEKEAIKTGIPAGAYSALGLSSVLGKYRDDKEPAMAKSCAAAAVKNAEVPADEVKRSMKWLWWLLLSLLLLILCILWWRACNRDKAEVVEGMTSGTTTEAPAVMHPHPHQGPETVTLLMPDGNRILANKGGIEDNMVTCLKEGKYAAATDAELAKRWFMFNELDFVHGSSTELIEGSDKQLDNIASILKNYPETKVMVAGFADKTGSEDVNREISWKRSEYIKEELHKRGIAEARVSTLGLGEKYAAADEKASDAERAHDRGIAIRFVK